MRTGVANRGDSPTVTSGDTRYSTIPPRPSALSRSVLAVLPAAASVIDPAAMMSSCGPTHSEPVACGSGAVAVVAGAGAGAGSPYAAVAATTSTMDATTTSFPFTAPL